MVKLLVHNYVKEYPDYYKIIQYANPRYVGKNDDVIVVDPDNPVFYDVFNPDKYYANLPRDVKRIMALFDDSVIDVPMPVINESFEFLNDMHSKRLWDAYLNKKRVLSQPANKNSTEASVRRSKRIIKDLIYVNDFDMWVTFTFAAQLKDIDIAKKRLSQWLKDQQKTYGSFAYLVVPEYHKSGAVHFHGLLKGYNGSVIPAINPYTGKQVTKKGRLIYNIASYGRGFTTLEYVDNTMAVSRYISKYITKDTPVLAGKRRFFHSKGLKKPVCVANSDLVTDVKKVLYYKNSDFAISYLSKTDIPD